MDEADNASEPVPCIQVASCIATGLSEDDSAVLFRFIGPNGKEFALMAPIHTLGPLRSMVGDAIKQCVQKNVDPHHRVYKPVTQAAVMSSPDHRNVLAMVINPNLSTEEGFVFPDKLALEVAELLRNNVMERMGAGDRAKLMTAPLKPKLILPGH